MSRSLSSLVRRAGLAVLLLVSISCARNPPATDADPALRAERLRAACGSAHCLTADLLLRMQPPQQEAVTMELALRRRADGRLRLDLSQVDVRFASILLLPDHSLTALLPRDHAVARETASQVPAGGAFTPASLLLFLDQELVYGPVPPGVVTGVNPDDSRALRLLDPATGFIAQVELDADDLVTSKRLFASDGKERLRLVYDSAQWKDFSTVRRPTRCTATLADGSVFDVRLRRLRPVPAIADGGLQLDIPADAKTMSIDALAELLTVQPAEEKK